MGEEKKLTLTEIVEVLDAELLLQSPSPSEGFSCGLASDLMSDVLAFMVEGALLLSGLAHDQLIRTADMVNCQAVLLVRGKRPTPQMLELAEKSQISVLTTHHSMYGACGLLHQAGLPPVIIKREDCG